MTSLKLYDIEPDAKCVCGNCDWTGPAESLDIIEDAQERLTPGSVVPAGECPECGCLAYLETESEGE